MSLETRSNSALMKRAEQLKRWQDSETFREPGEPRSKNRRIGFSDGCVFLAACAAGDREEVKTLLARGADIDTANVDGLTALHQACIDDNLEMVEFLVDNGADVDRGDNEGWTPLHATASCGFLSIARYLLDHGSNVAAVNNDGELAIDISESDEMEELLQKEIDLQKVNCDEARNREEQCMLDDARDWKNSGKIGDRPHHKTGATALHVAAAKGYIKVIHLLIQAGVEINQQDFDGWTPLHAAAHWAQREACELLTESYVNMDIKNCVGQTPFDVADPDVLRLLEELKKKQNNCSKDRPDIKALISRPPTTPSLGKGGRRSSITRLSQQEKVHSTKEITAKETIKEEKERGTLGHDTAESDRESNTDTSESARGTRTLDSPGVVVTDELGKEAQPNFLPPHPEANQQGKDDTAAPWRRPGSLRARPTNSSTASTGKLSPSSEDMVTVRRAHSFGSDEKRKVSEDITKQSPDLRPRSQENLVMAKTGTAAALAQAAQVRRSFVPPVRDEEHEIQRKAHAKRVRETRRSTQGVTLEDLKSAEQLVKKKQQQENATRTTELQQLAAGPPSPPAATPTSSLSTQHSAAHTTATTTVTTSATLNLQVSSAGSRPETEQERQERRPSWRLRIESGDKSRFTLEDTVREGYSHQPSTSPSTSSRLSSSQHTTPAPSYSHSSLSASHSSHPSPTEQRRMSRLEAASARSDKQQAAGNLYQGESEGAPGSPTTGLTAVQRKKKPKRRSTGVLSAEDLEPRSEESADENGSSPTHDNSPLKGNLKANGGGQVDYRKLWEESQAENARLRLEMNETRIDLDSTKQQLESAIQVLAKNSVSDIEKREKKVLEKKLGEMEDELKTLEQLKADNQRLRDENGALIRVISKLSK